MKVTEWRPYKPVQFGHLIGACALSTMHVTCRSFAHFFLLDVILYEHYSLP